MKKSLTMYRLSEHSLAIGRGRHRQNWHPREDRQCSAPTAQRNEAETELHFLTTCQLYQGIRDTYFPKITNTQEGFENITNNKKCPYLLGEVQQCANTAARCVRCCDRKRMSNGIQAP